MRDRNTPAHMASFHRWFLRCVVGGVLSVAMVVVARGTSIDPLTWEELVAGADCLGVVECDTAGGIVAKYRVIDSWKGPENGSEPVGL